MKGRPPNPVRDAERACDTARRNLRRLEAAFGAVVEPVRLGVPVVNGDNANIDRASDAVQEARVELRQAERRLQKEKEKSLTATRGRT